MDANYAVTRDILGVLAGVVATVVAAALFSFVAIRKAGW